MFAQEAKLKRGFRGQQPPAPLQPPRWRACTMNEAAPKLAKMMRMRFLMPTPPDSWSGRKMMMQTCGWADGAGAARVEAAACLLRNTSSLVR